MNTFSLAAILLTQGLALQACLRSDFAFGRAAVRDSQKKPIAQWHAEQAQASFAMFFWLAVSIVILLASI